MSILPKIIYGVNAIPINIPDGFSVQPDKLILKFISKYKEPKLAKTILKQKSEPDFKTFYKATGIKTAQ